MQPVSLPPPRPEHQPPGRPGRRAGRMEGPPEARGQEKPRGEVRGGGRALGLWARAHGSLSGSLCPRAARGLAHGGCSADAPGGQAAHASAVRMPWAGRVHAVHASPHGSRGRLAPLGGQSHGTPSGREAGGGHCSLPGVPRQLVTGPSGHAGRWARGSRGGHAERPPCVYHAWWAADCVCTRGPGPGWSSRLGTSHGHLSTCSRL